MEFMTKRNYRLTAIQPIESINYGFTDDKGLKWKWTLIGASLVTIGLYFSACAPNTDQFTTVGGVRVQVSPNKPMDEPLGVLIDRVATEVGIHPSLARSLVQQESSFNPNALSKTNAVGLTQVLRSTAKSECGIPELEKLANKEENLRCGFGYYKKLEDTHKSSTKALYAYTQGAKFVNKPSPKTVIYARTILSRFKSKLLRG